MLYFAHHEVLAGTRTSLLTYENAVCINRNIANLEVQVGVELLVGELRFRRGSQRFRVARAL